MKVILLLVFVFLTNIIHSQGFYNTKFLEDPGEPRHLHFGYSVSVSGDYLAVGAFGNSSYDNPGSVSLWCKKSQNWEFVKTIQEGDSLGYNNIGENVSLDGEQLLLTVSQRVKDNTFLPQKAYLYLKDAGGHDNWGLIKEFSRPPDDPGSFAINGVIKGEYVIIVGIKDSSPTTYEINIYNRNEGGVNNWGLVKQLQMSSIVSDLELDGDKLLIGCKNIAYLYYRNEGGENNWGLKKIFTGGLKNFCRSLAMNNEYIILGESGVQAVWLYGRNIGGEDNWGFIKKIKNYAPSGTSDFGYSLAITGDTLIIGDPNNDGGGTNMGAVYMFQKDMGGENNWGQLQYLLPLIGGQGFGNSIDIDDEILIIGESARRNSGFVFGAAHIFEPAINTVPYFIKPLYHVAMYPGEEITHEYKGYDPDGDECFISMVTPTFGDMTFSDEAVLTYKPTGNETGEHKIIIALTDNKDGTVYDTTIFKVHEEEAPYGFEEVRFISSHSNTNHSVSGDYAVFGDPEYHSWSYRAGRIRIHQRNSGGENNWGEIRGILYPHSNEKVKFGEGTTIENENIFVKAPRLSTTSDTIYIYNKDSGGYNNWGLHKKIFFESDTTIHSFEVDGSQLVVKAYDQITNYGWLLVYEKDTGGEEEWGLQSMIHSPHWTERFAERVYISDEDILVQNGEYNEYMVFSKNSAAENNWDYITTINTDSAFYARVSFKKGILAVGKPYAGENNTQSGTVDIFQKNSGGINNWGLVKKIKLPTPHERDLFGSEVELCGSTILIEGPYPEVSSRFLGALYMYNKNQGGENNWGQVSILTSQDPWSTTSFGSRVSYDNKNLIVSASTSYSTAVYFLREPGVVDVKPEMEPVQEFKLSQNYPNPFNPSTKISYFIDNESMVSLKIFNILGEEVAILVNERQKLGNYNLDFNAKGLTSGVYFYTLQAGENVQSKKMLILK